MERYWNLSNDDGHGAPESFAQLRNGLEASCSGRCVVESHTRTHFRGGTGLESSFGTYRILRELNRGATAVVYEAVNCPEGSTIWETPEKVALKVMNTTSEGAFCVPPSVIQREISCSSRLTHRNITTLLDVVADQNGLALAMELVRGPDLLDFVEACGRRVPEDVAVFYFRQLLEAVAHMHASGIGHRDLKPENCMIDLQTHTLKVIDFGLAAPLEAAVPPGCGTVYTIAPECLSQEAVSGPEEAAAIDAWGLGVTLYITLVGRFPFQDYRRPNDDQRTICNTLAGHMNPIPDHVSPAARHLIISLLQTNPSDRPSLEQVASHPFVTKSIRQQQIFAFEGKIFSGSYGLPLWPRAGNFESISGEAASRGHRESNPAAPLPTAGFLMDRFLSGMPAKAQQPVRAKAPPPPASPASQARQKAPARRTETRPSLQIEVVRAALEASSGKAAAATTRVQPEPAPAPSPPDSSQEPTWSTLPQSGQYPESPKSDCCTARNARKLFTLSADARPQLATPSLPLLSIMRTKKLLPVPEAPDLEQAEVMALRAGSLMSSLSGRSDSTVFTSSRGGGWSLESSLLSAAASAQTGAMYESHTPTRQDSASNTQRFSPSEKRRFAADPLGSRRRLLFDCVAAQL